MATEGIFNLGRLVQLLQFKRGEEPEWIYTVQPVVTVGDISKVTPFVSSPRGVVGGLEPADALQFGAMRITSRSQGGTLVRDIRLGAPAGAALLIDSPKVFVPTAPVANQVEVGPMVTVAEMGVVTAAGVVANDEPRWVGGETPPEVFIPNGGTLLLQNASINQVVSIAAQVIEFPALRGD